MEVYDSEEQQIEAIKNWWSENGKAVIVGVVVGLGGIFGWRYYQDAQLEVKADASNNYTQIIENLQSKGMDASSEVQDFIDNHQASNYSALAGLQLAKVQVDAGQLDEALTQLKSILSNTDDEALSAMINIRMARILSVQEKYDDAVTQLDLVKDEAWQGRMQELKGDILLQKGDKDGAREAYTKAQQASPQNQALGLKLDDLAQ